MGLVEKLKDIIANQPDGHQTALLELARAVDAGGGSFDVEWANAMAEDLRNQLHGRIDGAAKEFASRLTEIEAKLSAVAATPAPQPLVDPTPPLVPTPPQQAPQPAS